MLGVLWCCTMFYFRNFPNDTKRRDEGAVEIITKRKTPITPPTTEDEQEGEGYVGMHSAKYDEVVCMKVGGGRACSPCACMCASVCVCERLVYIHVCVYLYVCVCTCERLVYVCVCAHARAHDGYALRLSTSCRVILI